MIQIPKQLNNCKFILADTNKHPIEDAWTTISNYNIDDPILTRHIESSPIYGVLTGLNNMIVVDFDNSTAQENLLPHLPPTFTIKTAGKGLNHMYYYTDDVSTRRYNDATPDLDPKKRKGLLDIQGKGAMVIAPNSVLSTGKSYEITNDIEISTISKKDLIQIIEQFIGIPFETSVKSTKKLDKDLDIFKSPEIIKIKENYKIKDLLQKVNIPINKNPTECPFHDSESKKCLSYGDDLWHCFHCGRGGDVITLHQELYNLNFKQSITNIYKELFIAHQEYDKAMQEIAKNINSDMSKFDIDNVAQILIDKFTFVTIEETDKVHYYDANSGIYKCNGEYIIGAELEKYFKGYCKTAKVNEIVNKIKRLTHKPLSTFDSHKNLICLKNGIFNLDTKLLLPHSPDYYFINSMPIDYNESATCPKIIKFISEIVEDKDKELIKELFGFVIMKDYDLQKAIMMIGNGANGKSVLLYLMRTFLGEKNISAETLQKLTDDPFSSSMLYGKLANISADINDKTLNDTGLFKDLTSGMDSVSAQFKHQNKFEFVNYAKLIFSCNALPRTRDSSPGFFRRIIIIKFPYTFEGKNDNKNLKKELTTDEELSGLFNLAIEKYIQLKNNQCFTYSATTEEVQDEYTNMADPLQVFIDEYLLSDGLSNVLKHEFYDEFIKFCTDKKIPKISVHALTIKLKYKNVRFKTVSIKIDDKFTTREALVGYCWRER